MKACIPQRSGRQRPPISRRFTTSRWARRVDANEKFGAAATIVIQHRNSVRQLAKAAVGALDEWKANAEEREKEEQDTASTQRSQIQSYWTDVNQKMSSDPRGKESWGEDTADKEVTEALQKGFSFADKRFSEAYDKLSIQEKILLDASIRHRVAGFYKRGVLLRRMKADLEAAQKRVKDLEDSGPGKPDGGGGAPAAGDSEGAMAEFDKKM